MAVSSIHDMLTSMIAQRNLSRSSSALQANASRLSSGSRFDRAATDIAALSIATGLASSNTSLRTSLQNMAQASSLLQVADGGLQQIGAMMERMQALAVQANSGALSPSGRAGLNAEFQSLRAEIDRLAGNTNFNGVNLIDGSLGAKNQIQTATSTATQASGSLNFTANLNNGDTIRLNGQTLTAGTDFQVGATIGETLTNLSNTLNNSGNSSLSQATYERVGNSLKITAKAGGEAGNQFTIDQAGSTAAFTVTGNPLGGNGMFSLQGGANDGLSAGSTKASGTVGDSLVTGLAGGKASATIRFNDASDIQDGDTIQIDDGEGGFTTFTFRNNASGANEIQIGSTLEQTLGNAASTLDNYQGADDYGIRQLDFRVNGRNLEITSKNAGNPTDANGNPLNLNLGTTGGSLSRTTLDNGAVSGVDATGITNPAFTGKIQGFKATFTSSDNVSLSVKVGNETYTAQVSDTTPGANATVRFTSQNGGYFDVQLQGGQGQSVGNQSDANTYASRLNAAFSNVNFTQNRQVSNFNGTGQLQGARFEISGRDFSDLDVEDVRVSAAPPGADSTAVVEFRIDGETYRSNAGLGKGIEAGESVEFTSVSDPSKTLTFKNGGNAIDLSTNSGAATFEKNLQKAFNAGSGGGLPFQLGDSSSDMITINLGSATSGNLLGGPLDLLSLEGAQAAAASLSAGLNQLTSFRADVGSMQSVFDFASANVATALQNQEAARAVLADTDIASEATDYASNQVRQQAALAVLAQSNRLSGGILKLLGGG